MEIISELEEIGLTKTEAQIYLALVKHGSSTAYSIAKKSGLYRANTYLAIDSLVKKNLVIKEVINERQIFKAVSPEELIKNLERQKEKIQEIVPLIQSSRKEEVEEVSVFTGDQAFMNHNYNMLEKKKPIKVFDIPRFVPEMLRKVHIDPFHKERIKRKIPMYHIYDYDAKERIAYLNKLKYTYAKRGHQDRLSLTSTMVCGDTTTLINWKKGIKFVKITDKDIAKEFEKQFDLLWNYKS